MDENQNSIPVSFDFNKERGLYDIIIGQWKEEKDKVTVRRKVRENKKNVEEERQKGNILEDETIIPDRTINTNIKRGRVSYISYITQSRRLLILEDQDDPKLFTEPLEEWLTKGMRYPNWKIAWIRNVDCMHTHGGCALEVVYDPTRPFNCAIEYIPREHLIFDKKTKNIQASPRLLRQYDITTLQLEEFSDSYGFNKSVVSKILDRYKNETKPITIYRILFKRDKIVYNSWYSQDDTVDWLREPEVHNIGLFSYDMAQIESAYGDPLLWESRLMLAQPKPLTAYPITWFSYDVTEDEVLLDISGRTALDIHVQEALTQLLTNTVNASTRASAMYPSVEGTPGDDPKMRELGRLKPGIIMSRPLTFNTMPWPNNIILAVTQVLDQRKSQETGDVDFAALARKDANKTATEMNLATQQSSELSITALDVFSSAFLDIYSLCYMISRDQAIFGLCKGPAPEYFPLLFNEYHYYPAGDTEVLKRAEDKAAAKEFFDLTRGTPMAEKIFSFLLQRFFPDEYQDWIAILNQPDKTQIIVQLLSVIQAIPTDELSPEQRTSLQAIIISAQNVVGAGSDATVPGSNAQSPAGTPPVSNAAEQTVAGA